MTPEHYLELGQQGYNHVPVVRQLFADLDTPLSCYVKVARGPYSYLLESAAQGGEKWARYSVVGLPSDYVIKIHGNRVTIEEQGAVTDEFDCEDPLTYIEEVQAKFSYPDLEHMPVYTGGLVGYFSYDTVRYVEKRILATTPPDTLGTPDILLMVSNDVIIFDNVLGRIHVITHGNPADPGSFDAAQA
ncbi:MAG: anthranilate synthase component I, partial [Gammaproteobacteria bacterium]